LEAIQKDPDAGHPYWSLGNLYWYVGRNDGAFLHLQQAAALFLRQGDKDSLARVLQNQANIWQKFGETDLARKSLEEAYDLFLELNLQVDSTWVMEDLAALNLSREDRRSARSVQRMRVALPRTWGQQPFAKCLLTLVNFLDPVTELEEIERIVHQVSELQSASGRPDMIMAAKLLLGMKYTQAGLHTKAIITLDDVRHEASVLQNRDQYLPQIHSMLAEAYQSSGDFKLAEQDYLKCLAGFEENFREQRGEEARGEKFGDYAQAVYSYVGFLADRGRSLEAFELLEGTKSWLSVNTWRIVRILVITPICKKSCPASATNYLPS
jgi:tetratricopeptide (TPR) repeat protein